LHNGNWGQLILHVLDQKKVRAFGEVGIIVAALTRVSSKGTVDTLILEKLAESWVIIFAL